MQGPKCTTQEDAQIPTSLDGTQRGLEQQLLLLGRPRMTHGMTHGVRRAVPCSCLLPQLTPALLLPLPLLVLLLRRRGCRGLSRLASSQPALLLPHLLLLLLLLLLLQVSLAAAPAA
jgi:hypothetical protein